MLKSKFMILCAAVGASLSVGCKKGAFGPSIDSAKPLSQNIQKTFEAMEKNQKSMQEPAFKKWVKEEIIGRKIEAKAINDMAIRVSNCDRADKSECRGKYTIKLGEGGGLFSVAPIHLYTDDEKALELPKKGKIAFKGIVDDAIISLGGEPHLDIAPCIFQIEK